VAGTLTLSSGIILSLNEFSYLDTSVSISVLRCYGVRLTRLFPVFADKLLAYEHIAVYHCGAAALRQIITLDIGELEAILRGSGSRQRRERRQILSCYEANLLSGAWRNVERRLRG